MISDDEYLERIVAGIHSVTSEEAAVSWNEIINGRQFDVVIRFKLGTLSYLVLVEVKNRTRKASASDVEAFILKSHDQNANKSVFVTTAGFQKGAVEVARRHGTDLFIVSFDQDTPELSGETTWIGLRNKAAPPPLPLGVGPPGPVNQIDEITLVYSDGRTIGIPNESSQMRYYVMQSKFADGRTLDDIITSVRIPALEPNETFAEELDLTAAILLQPPDELCFPAGLIRAIRYSVTRRIGRPLLGNTLIEPTAFRSPVLYTDVTTGETTRFNLSSLPLGTKKATPGSFYFNTHPLRYYYCNSIDGFQVTWTLVESFQNARLIQATFTQDVKYSLYYIPVTDSKIVARLRVRLNGLN